VLNVVQLVVSPLGRMNEGAHDEGHMLAIDLSNLSNSDQPIERIRFQAGKSFLFPIPQTPQGNLRPTRRGDMRAKVHQVDRRHRGPALPPLPLPPSGTHENHSQPFSLQLPRMPNVRRSWRQPPRERIHRSLEIAVDTSDVGETLVKLLSLIVAAVFVVLAIVLTLSVANSTSQLTVTSAVAVSPFRPDRDTDQLGCITLIGLDFDLRCRLHDL
jgi:hypothetical protein